MHSLEVQNNIDCLRNIFSIILALAIGEAFKQFIVDRATQPEKRQVHWDRLLALVSFMSLVIPFYHGMVRYFFEAYNNSTLSSPYGTSLCIDCSAFTVESILFFVLSRSLSILQWRSFYFATVALSVVDALWVLIDMLSHMAVPPNWLWLDVATIILIGGLLCYYKSQDVASYSETDAKITVKSWLAAIAPMVLLLLRFWCDYHWNHSFYFPSDQPGKQSSVEIRPELSSSTTHKTCIYFAAPLFTQAEWMWNETVANELRKMNYDVLLPQSHAVPMLSGQHLFDPQLLFSSNVNAIEKADVVLAVLDEADPDSGTCWECGYATKLGRPIVGLRTDLRHGGDDSSAGINLMLSQSCKALVLVPTSKINDASFVVKLLKDAIEKLSH